MNRFAIVRLTVLGCLAASGCNQSNAPTAPQIDLEPPAAVIDLTIERISGSTVTLGWTAPGDDGTQGRATTYDLRFNESLIHGQNWLQSTQTDAPAPISAGQRQTTTVQLEAGKSYFIGIRALDENDNQAPISNLVTVTLDPNGGGGNQGGGNDTQGTIDLVVMAGTASPDSVHAGDTLMLVGWGIRNDGTLESPATRIAAYISDDGIIGTRDHLLGSDSIDPLAGGHGRNFAPIAVTIGNDITPGDYFLGLLIDPADVVDETDERHNFGVVRITVLP